MKLVATHSHVSGKVTGLTMPLNGEKTSMFQPQVSAPKQRVPLGHSSNQARETSQQRGERSRSHSQTSNREPLRPPTANRQAEAASLKVDVINNVPSRFSNLKHQTSQSTLDEQENGNSQKMVKQEAVPRAPSHGAYPVCSIPSTDAARLNMNRCMLRTTTTLPISL